MYLMALNKEQNKEMKKGVIAPEGILDTDTYFKHYTALMNKMNGWNMSEEEMAPTQKEVIE
ncbi:MAG: hypothetical protein PHR37_00035 [Eubacteriales bacterium]|nr:hypothetical protein [Eubacteriales bacterium]